MRIEADLTASEFIGVLVDRYIQPLLSKVEIMSQQVTDLQTAVTTLTQTVAATVANETALKQKLDAAIADNTAKAATITDLQAQLDAAKANASDPADTAAITAVTSTIQAQNQTLADATAQTAPTN